MRKLSENKYMVVAFPITLMVLDIAASIVWFAHRDWRRGLYWAGAALLTFTVTF